MTNNTKLTSEDCVTGDAAWEKETGIEINNINYSYDKNGKIDGVVVVGGISGNNNYSGIIAKYDLDGNFICEYKSAKEAGEKNNVDSSSISRSCRKNKPCKNYKYYYGI